MEKVQTWEPGPSFEHAAVVAVLAVVVSPAAAGVGVAEVAECLADVTEKIHTVITIDLFLQTMTMFVHWVTFSENLLGCP